MTTTDPRCCCRTHGVRLCPLHQPLHLDAVSLLGGGVTILLALWLSIILSGCGARAHDVPTIDDTDETPYPLGATRQVEKAVHPLTFGYAEASNDPATDEQLETVRAGASCAIQRWHAAACIDGLAFREPGEPEPAHYLIPRSEPYMGGAVGWTLGPIDAARIRMANWLTVHQSCNVALHEIGGHVARKMGNEGHVPFPHNGVLDGSSDIGEMYIDSEAIARVCLKLGTSRCHCHNPEPVGGP